MVGPRLPLGEDLVVGHVHARGAADTEGSSLSPRIKRRIRAKTSLAEIERKERGRTNIPGPPRLRTLVADAAEVPISEGSLVPASTPTSGPQRAHPYTPVGDTVGSSSFEMVPPVRARAASDRGFDDSADTIPIARANSSPSIIQVPTHRQDPWLQPRRLESLTWCCALSDGRWISKPQTWGPNPQLSKSWQCKHNTHEAPYHEPIPNNGPHCGDLKKKMGSVPSSFDGLFLN